MQTISINLLDSIDDFALREQQRERLRDKLEAELIKGIESGFGEPTTPEYWQRVREGGRRRLAQRKGEN